LALFNSTKRSDSPSPRHLGSTLHHIAFYIPLKDFAGERMRLERLGLKLSEDRHREVHWRSLYLHDSEGNQLELVSYDRSVA
jgi:catechol-2,3-dioxygenase